MWCVLPKMYIKNCFSKFQLPAYNSTCLLYSEADFINLDLICDWQSINSVIHQVLTLANKLVMSAFCSAAEKPWHVTSMSDTLVHRLMESSSALMEERVACNRHCLARVYPSCSKVDSSNYNPQPMWNCGFQIGEEI